MMNFRFDPLDDYAAYEAAADAAWERRHFRELLRHPSCDDPDHPGCEGCAGEDDEQEDA